MGCRKLEHLFLQDCIIGDNISSKTLKILTINMSDFGFLEYDCCISTPSVTALTLFDPEGRVPLLKDMASLVSASVSHGDDFSHFDTAVDVHRLLTSLCVTNLALDFDGAEEVHTRRIVGKLEEKSSTCERLKVVEIICIWDDPMDPLVNRVEEFFSSSGMTSLQIRIKHLHGCDCELIQR